MNYIAECLKRFQELDDKFKTDLGAGTAYLAMKSLEDEYQVHLSFVLVLLAVGELEENDVAEYLQLKFKLDATRSVTIAQRLAAEAYYPAVERALAASALREDESLEIKYQAFELLSIFEGSLLSFLQKNPAEIKDFNIAVFAAIDADNALEDKLINALYANKELISNTNIMLGEREVRPTVANWIKHFVADSGSGLFDGLVLAKYLSTSASVSQLSASDKNLLSKVLKTYRNLVFFPESMDNIPLELWEVLPVENENGMRDVLADGEMDEQPILKKSVTAIKEKVQQAVVTEAPTAGTDNEPSQLAKLQAALNDYSPNSLEYKVIKQELDRLRQLAGKKNI